MVECDDVDARMVLVDADGKLLADTEGEPYVVVVNAPRPEELGAALRRYSWQLIG